MKISGNIVDIFKRDIYPAEIKWEKGIIRAIERRNGNQDVFILPGLVDAHVHIESSMVTPGSFAVAAVSRGTTAVVSDPHEIANVMGLEGVRYMIDDSKKVPLKFFFGAPSCVPATNFETNGASISPEDIEKLLDLNDIRYLSEMMNYPGVIFNDPGVMLKIELAKRKGKPVDGHAPGLSGEDLKKYVSAGITTDHECSTIEEAREKISLGMKVIIREGSAARNLDNLKDLIRSDPEMVMLCSDDLHPDMLMKRHINKLVAKLVKEGYDVFDTVRACTLNPANHYGLNSGLLRPGDPADFIMVDDIRSMNILKTYIDGEKVFEKGKTLFKYSGSIPINRFRCSPISREDIMIKMKTGRIRVIDASDGELLTGEAMEPAGKSDFVESDIKRDILKLVVKDRYTDSAPSVAFIRGFGIKSGAFASSIAHDSHNIISVGTNDNDIVKAVNKIVEMHGGLAVSKGNEIKQMKLGIAGIMSDQPVREVAEKYEILSDAVKSIGCQMMSPFMTLSFMALLVIPELKLSDRGLFDAKNFRFVPLFEDKSRK